jgi:hypothetical protein
MEEVQKTAERYGFDIHRVPGKYFVLCDWYAGLVQMFDDKDYGYTQAMEWMKVQKEGAFKNEKKGINL